MLAVAACDPYDPDLGSTPFRCGTEEPRCPDGYMCMEYSPSQQICEAGEDSLVDAGPQAADAGPFVCNNDSEIEPNENINTASATPIPDIQDFYNLANLAICPDTDIDVFRFRVAQTGKNATVDLMHQSARGLLQVDILNATGTSIAAGSPVMGDNDHIRAAINNLPAGIYYVQVQASAATVQNNYETLDIATTGP
jgi:hypothetical protein